MEQEYRLPGQIEARSMQLIEAELPVQPASENRAVVLRVIHTTADFDYAQNLTFSPGACAAGVRAFAAGACLVTDTNMARAGVSKPALQKCGGRVECYMADPDVAAAAQAAGSTRAVAAMQKAARLTDGPLIFAVGNAPTALFELCRQLQNGLRPALIIGAPVGFVNVVESKRQLMQTCEACGVPFIVAQGRKGGSGVAAAICNALLYQATGRRPGD